MTYIPNSIEARDVASLVHMQTNLRKHQQEGPLVITRGDGCRVYDNSAKALSAAMLPISAVLINDRVHEAMLAQSDRLGNFAHGFTYAGHPPLSHSKCRKFTQRSTSLVAPRSLARFCEQRSVGYGRIRLLATCEERD